MNLNSLLRIPLYRILINIPIGFIAYPIFLKFSKLLDLQVNKGQEIILIFVYMIIGEVFCMCGELIVNFFFDYHPFHKILPDKSNNNSNIERVTPFDDKFITFRHFDKIYNSMEISEVHFVLSRMFAGLMVIFLCKEICVPFAFFLPLILVFIQIIVSKTKDCYVDCCIYLSLKILISCLLIFISQFAFFFLLSSIYYRSHANKLLYLSEEKNNENTKQQNEY